MVKSQLVFLAFILGLSLLRIVLAKPLRRTGWFVANSPRLALWAAGWALVVLGVSTILKLKHPAIEMLALAPIVSILFSMFLLVLIEAPAFWYAYLLKIASYFRSKN